MNKHLRQILFWAPRVAGILFVLFISLFALDIFDVQPGFWGTIVGLLMHLIPSILLTIAILVAWRWEWFGAALSMCLDTWSCAGWFSRLAEIHLHDSALMPMGKRGYGEDHKPLGHGDLELGRLLDRLISAQFKGPLIFELQLEEALESLKVVRQIRPRVFA